VQQFGCHSTDFHEILYLSIFRKSVAKVQVLLKSYQNNGNFTRRRMEIYDNVFEFLLEGDILLTKGVNKIIIRILYAVTFFENRAFIR
jgi:hypothetical protein